MQEIKLNEHHYQHKVLFLGILVLVLWVTVWTNVMAQRAVVMTLPTDYTVTRITWDRVAWTPFEELPSELQKWVFDNISTKWSEANSTWGRIQMTWSSIMTWVMFSWLSSQTLSWAQQTWFIQEKTWAQSDMAIVYARKIENLITIKWQETRINMILTMNKFLKKFEKTHPLYSTVTRMVDIITLGDVAYKLGYCTQFEWWYVIDLFGAPMNIISTIKYDATNKKCVITYQYPDKSVHTCRLGDSQKELISKMMWDKQWLVESTSSNTFESVVEQYLKQGVCSETQKAVIIVSQQDATTTGMIMTGKVSTSRWKFGK